MPDTSPTLREPSRVSSRVAAPQVVLGTGTETFMSTPRGVVRWVRRRDGSVAESPMGPAGNVGLGDVEPALADQMLLRAVAAPPAARSAGRTVRVVDLFAGCGGLSLGVAEACRALGIDYEIRLALDCDPTATAVYASNFAGAHTVTADITSVLDGRPGARRTSAEKAIAAIAPSVDVLVGGPPCQGHSDLNNRTRRRDVKNELYFSMVRAAEVLRPEHLVIENVPGALNDRSDVVRRSIDALTELGYSVNHGIVDLSLVGVPQRRKRLVVVASLSRSVSAVALSTAYAVPPRTVRWAIGDLVDIESSALLDAECKSAPDTRRRISYLFEQGLYDLPDSQRPACHAAGAHSYKSIYGRLAWDDPSPTVTTGFYSMCMGRYVHPARPRTLTAHEAARLQLLPDFFSFAPVRKRVDLATMIGNAVPMKLAYLLTLEFLR